MSSYGLYYEENGLMRACDFYVMGCCRGQTASFWKFVKIFSFFEKINLLSKNCQGLFWGFFEIFQDFWVLFEMCKPWFFGVLTYDEQKFKFDSTPYKI